MVEPALLSGGGDFLRESGLDWIRKTPVRALKSKRPHGVTTVGLPG